MNYWDTRATEVGGRVATFDGLPWASGTSDMVGYVASHLTGPGPFVDVGCGIGRMTAPVAAVTGGRCVGVDGSGPMLAQLLPGVTAAHADAAALPFRDGVFGGGWCVLVAQHLTGVQVAAMFAEAARTIRPGGRLVVQFVPGTTHVGPNQQHTPQEMRGYAEPSGWTLAGVASGVVHEEWMWDVWQR